MTTFRLPDGTEVTGYNCTLPKGTQHVWVQHPALGVITVDKCKLTELAPPLPVPDAPAVLVGDHVWARDDDHDGPLFVLPGGKTLNWQELIELADGEPIVPLIPDPAADAPPLPWHIGSCEREASVYQPRPVDAYGSLQVHVYVEKNDYTIDEVRQLAAVLLRAARDHEEASRG